VGATYSRIGEFRCVRDAAPYLFNDIEHVIDTVPLSNTTSPIPLHRGIRGALSLTQSPTSTPPTDDEPSSVMSGTKSRIWHVPAMEALRFSDDEESEDEGWFHSGR